MDIVGKRVAVTGAAGGLGGAIAQDLAGAGAAVFALDRPGLVSGGGGGGIESIAVDVTDESSVASAAKRITGSGASLDALVVSAGVQLHSSDGPVGEVSIDTWNRTLAVNMTGAFLVVEHLVGALCLAEQSSLVLIGSPTGLTMSGAGYTAYAASKAGMMALSRVVAADYAKQGVRANVVVPGTMRTPLIEPLIADDERRQSLLASLPVGRLGEPGDLTGLVRWLVSDSSSFATGGFFAVDGGLTAR